jgi:hypothetical protein
MLRTNNGIHASVIVIIVCEGILCILFFSYFLSENENNPIESLMSCGRSTVDKIDMPVT